MKKWEALNKFGEWLFNDDKPLDKDVIKHLNHKILITSFMFNDYFRKIMLDNFNSINIYSISIEELAKFIKHLVRELNLSKKELWWFSNLEPPTSNFDRLRLLKSYEKQFLTKFDPEKHLYTTKVPSLKKEKVNKKQQESKSNDNNTSIDEIKNLIQNIHKQKESSCSSCTLYDQPLVVLDTNLNSGKIQPVDVLFIAEAPGETEVKVKKPLVGKAGQVFRKSLLDKLQRNIDFTYVITNTVLCRPPSNRQPTDTEIKNCSKFVDDIILKFRPRLIVALGSTPMKKLLHENSGITKKRGRIYETEIEGVKFKVYLTVHPSYILRNPNNDWIYEEDVEKITNELIRIKNTVTNTIQNKKQATKPIHIEDQKSLYFFKIPNDSIYKNYDLVNTYEVSGKTIYKLRHKKDPKKLIRYEIVNNENFYYYRFHGKGKHVLSNASKYIDNGLLSLEIGLPSYESDNSSNDTVYEGDISPSNRFTIDYYYVASHIHGLDNTYKPRICYFDIEVFSDTFPDPEKAEFPITLISAKYVVDGKETNVTYILDSEFNYTENDLKEDDYLSVIKRYEIKTFSNEADLLEEFFKDINRYDVDILTAWNISFDIGYIINRIEKLDRKDLFNKLTPIGKPYVDLQRYVIKIPDLIILDLLSTYRFVSYGSRESYSLDYIVQYEGINDDNSGKKFKGSKFGELWTDNRIYAIAYNMEDVELIYKLDKKLNLVNFVNEFRNVTKVPWEHVQSTARTVDSLLMYYAKTIDKVIRNRISSEDKGTKVGAYVYPPSTGIHHFVYEVDFASLYPSIIQTFNISPTTYVAKFKNEVDDLIKFLDPNIDDSYKFEIILDPIYNPTKQEFTKKEFKQWIKENKYIVTLGGGLFKHHDEEFSILAEIIKYLKTRRKYYKKLFKETNEKKYDLAQLSYKITLNSIYGYLGFDGSRFKHTDLVNNITLSGQLINKLCSLTFVNRLRQEVDK